MNYGLPYMGSKNAIVEDVVASIPRGKKILDACCGGGAFLQCAAQSLRWNKVVGNDINPAIIKLLDAVLINKGQIEYEHPAPCSRNDFYLSLQRIENGCFDIQDCVNKYCASFGNSGKNYIYGKGIEEYKCTAETMITADSLNARRKAYSKFVKIVQNDNDLNRIQRIEELQRLEELERLERLERLENKSLFEIDYSEFDVVYFDIPYKNTAKYDFEFDHERFYKLFSSLKIPAFLSEYEAPFTLVAEFDKCSILGNNTKKINGLEKLYFNGSLDDYKKLMGREYRPKEEQVSLFSEV